MTKRILLGLVLIVGAVIAAAAAAFGKGVSTVTSGSLAQKTDLLARGIALAEGGWDAQLNGRPGTRPFRDNNPGDLREAGDLGTDSEGYGVFSTADYYTAAAGLADPASDGWAALFRQVNLILTGQSRVYSLDWTWEQVAETYDTGGDALTAWLPNVASVAGIQPGQTVREWLNA